MTRAALARTAAEETGADLFRRVGAFLAHHRLSVDPVHYAFAYHVMADSGSVLARAVAELTAGGVRLSRQDIEALGGKAVPGAPLDVAADPVPAPQPALEAAPATAAEQLAAKTSDQLDSFAQVVRAMHDEASGFGRDLAESAEASGRLPAHPTIEDIARITGAMLERTQRAELRLAAATCETEQLRERLAEARTTARRDPLTGLPNRRAFDEAFAAAGPGGRCIGVVDIDRFKRVNDEFGHAVGDRVLIAIGAALCDALPGHVVARHGGEEFAVLIDGTLTAAAALLDRARTAVAGKRFRSRETGESLGIITISGGITPLVMGETVEHAIARADRLLYAAKRSGRDAVVAD